MKSLGNDYVLSARQLPFHLFVEGWLGTHISLRQGANNYGLQYSCAGR